MSNFAAVEEAKELAEQLEKEREKRVVHLQKVAARRIGQMELAKGWSAWFEQWSERRRCKSLLAQCTARMSKPKLTACYKVWWHDWDMAQRAKVVQGFRALTAERQAESSSTESELRRNMRLANQAKHTLELEAARQERELTEKLELEKERRVIHLQKVAARRIGQMEMAKGWSAWLDLYWAHLRCQQLLRMSAARLMKPKLVACYKLWLHSWDEEQKHQLERSYARRLKEQTSISRQLQFEVDRLQRQLDGTNEDGGVRVDPEAERAKLLVEQLERERERRVVHLQNVAARRIGQMELAKGWSAWHEQYLARLRCTQLLRNATSMISKPRLVASYKVWLHDWHEAQAAKTEKSYAVLLKEQSELRRELEVELRQMKKELNAALAKVSMQALGTLPPSARMTRRVTARASRMALAPC